MTKKNQTKITFWTILMSFLIIIIHGTVVHIERNNLLKKGTETVGIVTHPYISKSSKITPYVIRFSFIKDDTIIDMTNTLDKRNALPGDKIDNEMFSKAVVGQTYRVRYFSNKPLKKARIFINEPVSVSDENYMKLLERVYAEQQRVEKSKTWWKNF